MIENKEIKVDIVVPVYNEGRILENSIKTLVSFLRKNLKYKWHVVIVNNGSIDNTPKKARELCRLFPGIISYFHLPEKGRGGALAKIWMESKADIVSYMDADLSTDLNALPELIDSIVDGYDIAIGSRLIKGARVKRCFIRKALSWIYNLLIKIVLRTTKFSDAQCGFKAMRKNIVRKLIPLIKNRKWFFDAELLFHAERSGFKIREIPVTWTENPDSRVNIPKAIFEDIFGLLRLRFGLLIKKEVF